MSTKIIRTQWNLLGEWWCAPDDCAEDEIAAAVADGFGLAVPPALVRDRLYGGFHCSEDHRRRHIYFSKGAYTYLNPGENDALTDDERREQWKTLIEVNGEPGVGPFTAAGPRP